MSDTEEEIYSVMFSSLRHPARRKILRMLSEKTMTFSQMLEELAIPSSHLTYHLENLGELIAKDKTGKYGLSSFGKASVCMMKSAEEVPNGTIKRFSALPIRWKSIFAILAISVILLASFSYVQYAAINGLSNDYTILKTEFDRIKAENEQLLSWTPSTTKAMAIINDVIQIDTTQYQTTGTSPRAQIRQELGGVIEETFTYSLVNIQSSIEITLKFRDGHFWQYSLIQHEGAPNFPPIYKQAQSADILQATKDLIQRYRTVENDTYLDEASLLLSMVDNTNSDQTLGNTKLRLFTYGIDASAYLIYTSNGTDFEAKRITTNFEKNHNTNILTSFTDDWFLYKVGSTEINISRDQAILAAKDAIRNFSWSADGVQVTNFNIIDNQISVVFSSKTKTDPLTLYPYWLVTLPLDQTYPGGVNSLAAGVWADTGQVDIYTSNSR
jgi:hypothetical protein